MLYCMFNRFMGLLWESLCATVYPASTGYTVYEEEDERIVQERDELREQKATNGVYVLAMEAESKHLERALEECRDELEEIRRLLEPVAAVAEHETALQRACNARAIIEQFKRDLEAKSAPTSKPKKARDERGRFLKAE